MKKHARVLWPLFLAMAVFVGPMHVDLWAQNAPRSKVLQAKLNINKASLEELEGLYGIGPEIAQRIVAYRESHGPFQSVDELQQVPGIGPAKIAKLKEELGV